MHTLMHKLRLWEESIVINLVLDQNKYYGLELVSVARLSKCKITMYVESEWSGIWFCSVEKI